MKFTRLQQQVKKLGRNFYRMLIDVSVQAACFTGFPVVTENPVHFLNAGNRLPHGNFRLVTIFAVNHDIQGDTHFGRRVEKSL